MVRLVVDESSVLGSRSCAAVAAHARRTFVRLPGRSSPASTHKQQRAIPDTHGQARSETKGPNEPNVDYLLATLLATALLARTKPWYSCRPVEDVWNEGRHMGGEAPAAQPGAPWSAEKGSAIHRHGHKNSQISCWEQNQLFRSVLPSRVVFARPLCASLSGLAFHLRGSQASS